MAMDERPGAHRATDQDFEKMNDTGQGPQSPLYENADERRATPLVMPEDIGDKIYKEPGLLMHRHGPRFNKEQVTSMKEQLAQGSNISWHMTGNADEIANILVEFAEELRRGDLTVWKEKNELHMKTDGKIHMEVRGDRSPEELEIAMRFDN